jgi:hypothetical protein
MPVNELDDSPVTLREPHGSDRGNAFESGKAGCHRSTLPEMPNTKKTYGLAIWGKYLLSTNEESLRKAAYYKL